jgi:hypothetical protein
VPEQTSMASYHDALAIDTGPAIDREEYLDHMTFRANRRPLLTEIFGPMPGLKEEWLAQGATAAELNLSAFRYRGARDGHVPVSTGWFGTTEEVVVSEDADFLVIRDGRGRLLKLNKGYASLPLPLDYPVATAADWERLKPHYLFDERRLPLGWQDGARRHLAAGRVLTLAMPGAYSELRELMGVEGLSLALYDQPELVQDMLDTFSATACRVFERVLDAMAVDQLSLGEDMAGKSGPLLSPAHARRFVTPYYRRAWDLARQGGARLFCIDSDGDLRPIIPELLDGGVNLLLPNEPAAGMDVVQLRAQYGERLAFMGGIDKHVLRRSKAEIEAELEYKVPPLVHSGGCVFALDHRIPNGTPLEHYRFYVAKIWEIMDREGARL